MDESVAASRRPHERRAHSSASDELLFACAGPPAKRRRLAWLVQVSVLVHLGIAGSFLLVPLYLPGPAPLDAEMFRIATYAPPPPPPPPPPSGSRQPRRADAPVVRIQPEKPVLTAPREIEEKPQDTRPLADDSGLLDGDDLGVQEGMEGGVAGGVVGGVPGGVVGGVPGGTGDGPVLDYDQAPRLLRKTKPVYTPEAFVKRIEGTVTVEVFIDSSGQVVNARVLRSIPLLDAAAIQCVRQWRFAPAIKQGRPVATLAHITVSFTLL